MKIAVVLALFAGAFIAVQASLNAAAGRTLGLALLIAFSGFATGISGLTFALFAAKPEFTTRAVAYGVASGLLGCAILACVTFAVGQGGVARALSLVIASQLIVGLILDSLGVFGAGADITALKIVGVVLIVTGGIFVVRF